MGGPCSLLPDPSSAGSPENADSSISILEVPRHDLDPDRRRQPRGLVETRLDRPQRAVVASLRKHEQGALATGDTIIVGAVKNAQRSSLSALPRSSGEAGCIVEMACL